MTEVTDATFRPMRRFWYYEKRTPRRGARL